MRLIDSNALIGALHNVTFEDGTDREIVYRCVELAPTIEERKTGKWHYYRCSECKCLCTYFLRGSYMIDFEKRPNYCPHCGAKMEVDNG